MHTQQSITHDLRGHGLNAQKSGDSQPHDERQPQDGWKTAITMHEQRERLVDTQVERDAYREAPQPRWQVRVRHALVEASVSSEALGASWQVRLHIALAETDVVLVVNPGSRAEAVLRMEALSARGQEDPSSIE